MEEVLVILIQVMVEILVQAVFYIPFDNSETRRERSGTTSGLGWMVLLLVVGGLLGGLSVAIAPHLMLPTVAWRVANMCVSPLAVGGLAYWLALGRRIEGSAIVPSHHFWLAFLFSLGYTAIRFAYGDRG